MHDAARGERRVGDRAHQAGAPAAVDEHVARARDRARRRRGRPRDSARALACSSRRRPRSARAGASAAAGAARAAAAARSPPSAAPSLPRARSAGAIVATRLDRRAPRSSPGGARAGRRRRSRRGRAALVAGGQRVDDRAGSGRASHCARARAGARISCSTFTASRSRSALDDLARRSAACAR